MAKQAPSEGTASRLPSTKESRPALIGLALVLIVGGALASAYLALAAGNRAEFVQVKQEIAQGQKITEDDLETVSLPEGYDGGVSADDMADVVGQSASVRLLAGTVLTPDMVDEKGGFPEGTNQTTVDAGQTQAEKMAPGSQVTLFVGSTEGDGTQVAGEVVSIGEASDDSFAAGSDGTVPVLVQYDSACNAAVGQGLIDDTIKLIIGPPAGGTAKNVVVC